MNNEIENGFLDCSNNQTKMTPIERIFSKRIIDEFIEINKLNKQESDLLYKASYDLIFDSRD